VPQDAPGVGDVVQVSAGGPPRNHKPVVKNTANHAKIVYTLFITLTVLVCIFGYQADAKSIEKDKICKTPNFQMNEPWDGSKGVEYQYFKKQIKKLRVRNDMQKKWIRTQSCSEPPQFHKCDLEAQKKARKIHSWLEAYFRGNEKAEKVLTKIHKKVQRFRKLMIISNNNEKKVEKKRKRCVIDGKKEESKVARIKRSTCHGLKEFNPKQGWKEKHDFLKTQSKLLKGRNEKKQNWINDENKACDSPPDFDPCDLDKEKMAKEIHSKLLATFSSIDIDNAASGIKKSHNAITEAGNMLKESSKLDSEIQKIIENCQKTTPTTMISITSTTMSPNTITTRVSSTTTTMSLGSSNSFASSSTLLFIFFTIFWFF